MRRRSARMIDQEEPSLLLRGSIPMASLIQTIAVAEYLNFRHAANALGVAQSSVSARVKALEEDLGILLFERHARGVRLTEAGRHFVDQITTAVHQIDHAVRTAGMVVRGEQGKLRIGIHVLIPGSFLAKLIARYRQKHPGVQVEIAEGAARDSVMQLRAGRLDVAFVAGSPEFPDCHSRRMWTERLLAALPFGHRLGYGPGVTWADLASQTFIVRHGGTGPQVHDHIVARLAGKGANPSILRFNVERGTLLSMVAQGYGVTIVGEAISPMQAPGVTFVPILDEPEPLPFSAVWSPHNQSAALTSLLDLAREMSRVSSTE